MIAATSGTVRPLGERDVELGIVGSVVPGRREAFSAVCVGQNRVAFLQTGLRQVAVHADPAGLVRYYYTGYTDDAVTH